MNQYHAIGLSRAFNDSRSNLTLSKHIICTLFCDHSDGARARKSSTSRLSLKSVLVSLSQRSMTQLTISCACAVRLSRVVRAIHLTCRQIGSRFCLTSLELRNRKLVCARASARALIAQPARCFNLYFNQISFLVQPPPNAPARS